MTHTTKHTPGPWRAVQHPREHKWAWTIEGADGGGQSIARIGLVNDAQAVAANAHLIAAAPAMYEALKALLAHEGERQYSGIGTEHDSDTLEGAKRSAKTALAQAEGRDK